MNKYFCGWYFKCQSDNETIALIPAMHQSGTDISCSLQLITDSGACSFPLSDDDFASGFYIGKQGLRLSLKTEDCTISGALRFGPFSPIAYDIMGPFRFIPFMECSHKVVSMAHRVTGGLRINGTHHVFDNALGYIEGDRGSSFPKEYVWTHSFFKGGSLMISAADIPFGFFHFTGTTCVIHWRGREIRLATYLGAKVHRISKGKIVITQGDFRLSAKLIEKRAHPLLAPAGGIMERTIHESCACKASYKLEHRDRTLFEFETDNASFEYEYPW